MNGSNPAFLPFVIMLVMVFAIIVIAPMWRIFEKAGEPGWASIVPIFNLYILLKIAGKPEWWLFLFLIPIVSLVIYIIVSIGIAEKFGQTTSFGIGLVFLPFLFYPILAFGNPVYEGKNETADFFNEL